MSYSVDDKIKYHRKGQPKGMFSAGYIMGAITYRSYGKGGAPVNKRARQKFIDETKRQAMQGDLYSKGIMCAVRDCANERKAKHNT